MNTEKLYKKIKEVELFINDCKEKLKREPNNFSAKLTLVSFERHRDDLLSIIEKEENITNKYDIEIESQILCSNDLTFVIVTGYYSFEILETDYEITIKDNCEEEDEWTSPLMVA